MLRKHPQTEENYRRLQKKLQTIYKSQGLLKRGVIVYPREQFRRDITGLLEPCDASSRIKITHREKDKIKTEKIDLWTIKDIQVVWRYRTTHQDTIQGLKRTADCFLGTIG